MLKRSQVTTVRPLEEGYRIGNGDFLSTEMEKGVCSNECRYDQYTEVVTLVVDKYRNVRK